jgi:hypothetical protein
MRIDRVRGSSDNLGSQFLKLFVAVGKRGDFGGADESEVQRIPEENDPFALVIAQCGTGNRTGGSIRSIGDGAEKEGAGCPTLARLIGSVFLTYSDVLGEAGRY